MNTFPCDTGEGLWLVLESTHLDVKRQTQTVVFLKAFFDQMSKFLSAISDISSWLVQ